MIARAISHLLRWLDRHRAAYTVRQFARARGLAPIEIAAVNRLVRTHYDAYGSRPLAIASGLACVLRIALRRPDRRPLAGVVIHLPRGRIGGAR